MSPESLKLALAALQALIISLLCDKVHPAEGNPLRTAGQHGATARQKHYETTVPLQLVGGEWKPVSQLKSQNHPPSLKLLVEVEGERLLLAVEKNQGLFASNFTETHYLEDGTSVTGPLNFTANCYYHGEVEGHVNSDVSLSSCAGIRGFVSLRGRSYMLEPCTDCSNGTHWIYSAEHLSFVSGTCGHGFNISSPALLTDSSPFKAFSSRDHSDNPLGAAVTLAHELGHNFGMNHDTPERGCGCRVTVDRGGCIMTPSTGYPFPTVFSSCSKKDLTASFEKGVGMCLFNMPELKVLYGGQKCGNGYVEEGEECDCGELEECMNPCCNATTCTLKGDAVCAHGHCCQDCQLKPAGTPCRESSNSCDLPEFCTGGSPHCPTNVYLHDGHSCHNVDGYCYNGICQTHEQQCITLWGKGAKPAPGICFERVNLAGDPYGNCGKDSKGSFAKCEARDAKCGKIQCQGGANRPVIGTNAVSIETNIPLQEGGRILCRGTHVYLGDDMPDPGLVLTGTKCGDGMMCLNRQCQNVSVFNVHECAAKCSGRGVCNNNKNCHCEAHWGPPFCDKAGFGGSVDSGPIRLADSRKVTVGVLVSLLTVLVAALIVCIKRKTLMGLLFTGKKNPIGKLRSEAAAITGPSAPKPPSTASATSPSRPALPLPHSATIFKSPHRGAEAGPPQAPYPAHSLRRLPQCPPVHLSHPVPLSLTLSLSPGPRQPRPPAPPPHRAPPPHIHAAPRGASFRSVSHHNSCRMVMELEKPSPPQKPLPANPRSSRLVRSPSLVQDLSAGRGSSVIRGPAPVPGVPRPGRPVPHPNRPSPKQPPTLPKPCIIANVKYSS
ncbi:disintegrin and metalloproteinase domain-containing protein 12-like isoform X2 [Kryptolebias marmoratus]|uniref:disintegrin and metalloproteinase domain-containing protein 12-like isoform X2 n=1 Tax=Kryptolebias marmoratus TaxID=37003 RepID=UPI0018AD0DD3|nr:disintegrin and metalloproteinase domain-containing protein 12-like isoform X2 [Kryptolebias marmoratus]